MRYYYYKCADCNKIDKVVPGQHFKVINWKDIQFVCLNCYERKIAFNELANIQINVLLQTPQVPVEKGPSLKDIRKGIKAINKKYGKNSSPKKR